MNVWKSIGKGLARTGSALLSGATWASNHPEVMAIAATAVGHPEIANALLVLEKAKAAAAAAPPSAAPALSVEPAPLAPPPVAALIPTASETWGPFIIETYRTGAPRGLNRWPEAGEILTDADTIAKKEAVQAGEGQRWLRHEMYQRNGLKEPEIPSEFRLGA